MPCAIRDVFERQAFKDQGTGMGDSLAGNEGGGGLARYSGEVAGETAEAFAGAGL